MINEADILVNNEVRVNAPVSAFFKQTGIVRRVMADGRSLDIEFTSGPARGANAFIDVTLVSEIQEPVEFAKGGPDLGPVANSVVQAHK